MSRREADLVTLELDAPEVRVVAHALDSLLSHLTTCRACQEKADPDELRYGIHCASAILTNLMARVGDE